MNAYDSISTLKGVGPKTKEYLEKMGLYTILDLLLYFPRAYDEIYEAKAVDFNGQSKVKMEATVVKVTRPFRTKTGKTLTSVFFTTAFGSLKAMFFNMPYVTGSYIPGKTYMLQGKFTKKGKNLETINPYIHKDQEVFLPVYPLGEKITSAFLRKLLRQVFDDIAINENFPSEILQQENLLSLDKSLRYLHFPEDGEKLEEALKRLKFQELFSYSLKIMLSKEMRAKNEEGIAFKMSPRLVELKESIPFDLTQVQNQAIREILKDQKRTYPMNRLLQGDVGSGKTIVALVTLFNVIENGYQAALMAPTEILARQHFEEATKLFSPLGIQVEILTGSTKKKNRDLILKDLEKGTPLLLIGTHALIEETVSFHNLGMLVTDEQHRFGVNQRAKLKSKSKATEVLVMSATPIPRTMALTIYSDLDLSIMDELPKGRKEIKTMLVEEAKRKICYQKVLEEVEKGRQAYIVAPLIQEDEDSELRSVEGLYEELRKNQLKGIEIAKLHGKMTSKEKNLVMESFLAGKIQVLLATTVIEVGVNVKNASIMVIENAERFGLAQLHQLRGRVGRGEYQSYCMMVAKMRSQSTRERLEIMVKSNDGFFIAEEDLKQRGTGELFGVNQSGDSGLLLADLSKDYDLFLRANQYAKAVYHGNQPGERAMKEQFLAQLKRNMVLICLN